MVDTDLAIEHHGGSDPSVVGDRIDIGGCIRYTVKKLPGPFTQLFHALTASGCGSRIEDINLDEGPKPLGLNCGVVEPLPFTDRSLHEERLWNCSLAGKQDSAALSALDSGEV